MPGPLVADRALGALKDLSETALKLARKRKMTLARAMYC